MNAKPETYVTIWTIKQVKIAMYILQLLLKYWKHILWLNAQTKIW